MIQREMLLNRLKALRDSFKIKQEGFYNKSSEDGATRETSDQAWDQYMLYKHAVQRTFDLFRFRLSLDPVSAFYPGKHSRFDFESRRERKKRRKEEWETKYVYSPWFMQTSLTADYGTFNCDRCHRTFYHSPSTISKGKEEIFNCCCGNCTNTIIYADHNKEPFQ